MRRNINEIRFDRQFFFKLLSDSDFKKYSLKRIDFQGERFQENEKLPGFNPVLSITKPEFISEIGERFFRVGCDFVIAQTGKLNRFYLKDIDLQDVTYELNFNYMKVLSEKANKYSNITVEKPRYIGAEIFDIEEDRQTTRIFYSEQIKGLLAGKADFVFLNNFKSFENTIIVLEVLQEILERRNKQSAYLIANKNEEYLKKVSDYFEVNTFDRLKFLGLLNILDTDEFPKSCHDGVLMNFSEEKHFEFSEIDCKIIGFGQNVSPEMIEKLLK